MKAIQLSKILEIIECNPRAGGNLHAGKIYPICINDIIKILDCNWITKAVKDDTLSLGYANILVKSMEATEKRHAIVTGKQES